VSIATLSTLAVVRDSRAPTRSDIGKTPPDAPDKDARATLTDLLVTLVPVEVVAPYTAVTAGIVNAIAAPTTENPHPDDYRWVRWIIFGVMLLTVFALVWITKRSKVGGKRTFPLLEIVGAVTAATAWAFLLPESPIVPHIADEHYRVIIPLAIGFVAVMINVVTATSLKAARNSALEPQPE
jgi:hypothetical protein